MTAEEIKVHFKKVQDLNIQMSLVDDIDSRNKETYQALQKADNAWKAYQDYLTRADAPFKKMIAERNNYLKVTTDIVGLLNKAVMAAKELGIPVENVKGYSALKANIRTGNDIIDTIDTFKDPSSFQ